MTKKIKYHVVEMYFEFCKQLHTERALIDAEINKIKCLEIENENGVERVREIPDILINKLETNISKSLNADSNYFKLMGRLNKAHKPDVIINIFKDAKEIYKLKKRQL